jgi:hypothetical protein
VVKRWRREYPGQDISDGFVTHARRYRTIQIQAGYHHISGADPLPGELCSRAEAPAPQARSEPG